MSLLTLSKNKPKTNISFFRSLRGKLTLYFLGMSLLPLLIVGIFSDLQNQQILGTQIGAQSSQLAQMQADSLNNWLNDRLGEIKVIAGSDKVLSLDSARVKEAIEGYAREWSRYEGIFVAGLDGMTIFRTDGDKPLNLTERAYFQKALQGEPNISDVLISKGTGNPIVIVAAPLIVEDKIVGVVGGTIPTVEIVNLLAHARTGQTGEAYLINSAGYMITPSRFMEDLKRQGLIKERTELELQVNTFGTQEVLAGKTGVNEYLDYRGRVVLGAYTPIERMGWGILIEADKGEALAVLTQLRNLAILISLITAVTVAMLAFFVSRKLTQPVLTVTAAARRLAAGDLNQTIEVKSRDELGVMAQAFQQMITYLQEMAGTADRLAQGDLTAEVRPTSDQDMLGQAFSRMIGNLRQLITGVTANAHQVGEASQQLAAVAEQAGQATDQVAQTMDEVATGTQQQTNAIAKTAGSMDQMTRAIDGVAKGAQEQAQAIAQTAQAVSNLTGSIQALTGGAQTQTKAVGEAKSAGQALESLIEQITTQTDQVSEFIKVNLQAAQSGQQAAREAVSGIDHLGTTTEHLAQAVRDLGKRSTQIGAIVETIDDIASQTNLLALNAAIEAARAGEHGKGFAVVADEVRKLAERSSSATKEIREMIQMVQSGAETTVEAMNRAGNEVQSGVSLTRQAGAAFETIASGTADSARQIEATLTAIQAVRAGSEQLAQAIGGVEQVADQNRSLASEMERAAQAVGELVDQVSAVVEENTAATEQMAASSSEVTLAIEDISSVSEENSAAVEEVSASAQEMSAQVEEVTASAQSLSELALQLQQVVSQFKIGASDQVGSNSVETPAGQPDPALAWIDRRSPVPANGHHRLMANGR